MAGAGLVTVLAAVAGAGVGAIVNSILGEEFRRVRDRSSLCAGLAGELTSLVLIIEGRITGLRMAHTKLTTTHLGKKLTYREHDMPESKIYDANASKVGLLGADLARVTAFAYVYVDTMRATFDSFPRQIDKLSPDHLREALQEILSDFDNAHAFAVDAADKLAIAANRKPIRDWLDAFAKKGLFTHISRFM